MANKSYIKEWDEYVDLKSKLLSYVNFSSVFVNQFSKKEYQFKKLKNNKSI